MVGPAYTLRYIPAREDIDTPGPFDPRMHPQHIAVENCPPGHVLVFDSRRDATAASAGGILVSRLLARGVAGAVTDGGFRDTPDIEKLSFPVITPDRVRRPISSVIMRSTLISQSAAAMSRSIPETLL